MSQEPSPSETIPVLILTTRPQDVAPAIQFLSRRQFSCQVLTSLKEGLSYIAKHKPEWVFLSINLSPVIDRYVTFLTDSFGLQPIVFADTLDTRSLTRLNRTSGHSFNGKLTGPSMQMKIRRILKEMEMKERQNSHERSSTSQQMKAGESHLIHFSSGSAADGGTLIQSGGSLNIRGTSSQAPVGLAQTEFASQLARAAQNATQGVMPSSASFRALVGVKGISVMAVQGTDLSGYVLIGSSLDDNEAFQQTQKLREQVGLLLKGTGTVQERFFGSVAFPVENFPAWVDQRSSVVHRYPANQGEILACYIPEVSTVPTCVPYATDPNKIQVHLHDIPVEVPLPCPWYVYLPRNDKYICLVKAQGHLSELQRERLLKVGVSHLLMAKEDSRRFEIFYIREKLSKI